MTRCEGETCNEADECGIADEREIRKTLVKKEEKSKRHTPDVGEVL
jgi:hypothetical protein